MIKIQNDLLRKATRLVLLAREFGDITDDETYQRIRGLSQIAVVDSEHTDLMVMHRISEIMFYKAR